MISRNNDDNNNRNFSHPKTDCFRFSVFFIDRFSGDRAAHRSTSSKTFFEMFLNFNIYSVLILSIGNFRSRKVDLVYFALHVTLVYKYNGIRNNLTPPRRVFLTSKYIRSLYIVVCLSQHVLI